LDTKELTIYITYGATVINNLSEQINFLLSDKTKRVNIAIISEDNPFIDGLCAHWGYSKEDLISKIQGSIRVVENLSKENNNNNLNILRNNKYPINYSFYLLDDYVYFVPAKLCNPKSFTPFTIKAQKTVDNLAMYGKVKEDFDKLDLQY